MKNNVVLHSINGILDSALEMEQLKKRIEMLILNSVFTADNPHMCSGDQCDKIGGCGGVCSGNCDDTDCDHTTCSKVCGND